MKTAKFRTVADCLASLPDAELEVLEYLRALILECAPACEERLSYNVPYYRQHSNFCFLWPASITWGNKMTYQGVRLGFTKGYLIPDESNYLDKGDHKQVYWKDFVSVQEIDADLIKSYIFDALIIDTRMNDE